MRFCTFILVCAAAIAGFAQSPISDAGGSRYRIQPTDTVEIHYRYTPEFDQTVMIPPDGFVSLQIAGEVKLQGLTLEEAKAAILAKASARLRDPEITVVLKDFEKPYFVVGGEVGNPGKFELRGKVNPIQAIAMAGGFKTASAKHTQVVLFRRVGPDLARTEVLDLRSASRPSSKAALADLHSGDVLVVPQNFISKIERFVKWTSIGTYWHPLGQ